MSNSGAIGFGGFLLGLGGGYLVFRELNLAVNSFAWILVIIGATIILSALIRYASPGLGIHRILGGLAGGLVFALFLTQGFSFFTGIVNVGNSYLPYSTTDVKTYTGASPSDSVYLRLGSMNGQITLSLTRLGNARKRAQKVFLWATDRTNLGTGWVDTGLAYAAF